MLFCEKLCSIRNCVRKNGMDTCADCDFYGKSDPQRIPGEVQLTEEHWKIFQAKIRIQLLLTGLPLFLCIVCTAAVCPLYSLQLLMIFLFTGSYVLLMALVGL